MPKPSEQPKVGRVVADGSWVRIDPRPEDDYQECPWKVSAEVPRGWRAAWAVLRGRYVPQLSLGRKVNMRMMEDTMKEVWVPSMEESLYDKNPLLDQIRKAGSAPPSSTAIVPVHTHEEKLP